MRTWSDHLTGIYTITSPSKQLEEKQRAPPSVECWNRATLIRQQVDLCTQSTLRVPPLCRRGTTSMKDVLSFRHGSDQEWEEENTACHEKERLEGRHVITAGVGRVVLPAAPPVLPRVVGVVQLPRRPQPRERAPPHHRRGRPCFPLFWISFFWEARFWDKSVVWKIGYLNKLSVWQLWLFRVDYLSWVVKYLKCPWDWWYLIFFWIRA